MFYYAQINEQGYCIGISSLSGEVSHERLIQLIEYDTSYIGRKYDVINQGWTDEYLPEPTPGPTQLDIIQNTTAQVAEDNLVVMMAQAEQYEEQMATRQDILTIMAAIAELYEMNVGGVK